MIMFEEEKKNELLRCIKWMTDFPEKWALLCMENNLEPEQCLEVIEELEEQGFYILIPVLLSHSMNVNVEKKLNKLVGRIIVDSWKDEQLEKISRDFKEIFRSS